GHRRLPLGSNEEDCLRLGGEMMRVVKDFLRDCVRLLYWVFFKPSAMRAHINQIAPGYEERLLRSVRSKQFEQALLRSPVHFDEYIFFPQPYLSSPLFHLLHQNLDVGLIHTAFVTTHPFEGGTTNSLAHALPFTLYPGLYSFACFAG